MPVTAPKGQPIELKPGTRITLGSQLGPQLTVLAVEGSRITVLYEEPYTSPSGRMQLMPVETRTLDLSGPTSVGRLPTSGIKVSNTPRLQTVSRTQGQFTLDANGTPVYVNTGTNPDRVDTISPERLRRLSMTPRQRDEEDARRRAEQRRQEEAARAAAQEREAARRAALTPEQRRMEDIRHRLDELEEQRHWAMPDGDFHAAVERERRLNSSTHKGK